MRGGECGERKRECASEKEKERERNKRKKLLRMVSKTERESERLYERG